MRIVYVAGFFKHVFIELQECMQGHLDDGAVVWIPQYGRTYQPNFNRLRGAFFDVINRGAEEILILAVVMRGDDYTKATIEALIAEANAQSPDVKITVEFFKDARDSNHVISKIVDFGPTTELPIPTNLDSLEAWVKRKYNDRVWLHPRAVDAAKDSIFADVALIYAAIDLLATEYWAMRTSDTVNAQENKTRFESKLAELGLSYSMAISYARAGEMGDEYKVNYPIGTDKKILLEYHLTKGSDRDTRFCLRIYFFWDHESKRVVIGWLPTHLTTGSS